MVTLLISISIFAFASGIAFLIVKYGPKDPVYKPCQHENVGQWWYDRQILQRKCLDCSKEELNRNNGFQKLWNPKFINVEPIQGIELEKMQYHKKELEEKRLKKLSPIFIV